MTLTSDHAYVAPELPPLSSLQGVNILHERADIEGATWMLLKLDTVSDPLLAAHLETLVPQTSYRNIFFEPAFSQLAAERISRREVNGLVLVEKHGRSEKLKFFAPVTIERTGKIGPKFMRVWSHEFGPLSHPVLDSSDLERIVEELCFALDKVNPSVARGLLMDSLPLNSEFSRQFMRIGNIAGKLQQFNKFERAALLPTGDKPYSQVHLSGKRRQRLRVARTRLDELGEVTFHEAVTLPDVEVAMLDFLYLEHRGWKGRRNSSLASNSNSRQFALEVVRLLAEKGNCRIFSLQLNGVMIASMVMLVSGSYFIPWKITFDERYSRNSVGNLLLVHVNDLLTGQRQRAFV